MLEEETGQSLDRYRHLVALLNEMNEKTEADLANDSRWFSFAPKVCRKFLNQAFTLQILFSDKVLEFENGEKRNFEDLSVIYTILRMLFETSALFYHLFIPCENIEENILRFRLWELDGIRYRIKYNRLKNPNPSVEKKDDQYLPIVEKAITDLKFYKALDDGRRKYLLDKSMWRFSSQSLSGNKKWSLSYEDLIKNAGIKDEIFQELYSLLSLHVHPGYVGVIQSYSLNDDEIAIGRYSASMLACFVTAFVFSDMSKRFKQAKEFYESLSENDRMAIKSVLEGSRKFL